MNPPGRFVMTLLAVLLTAGTPLRAGSVSGWEFNGTLDSAFGGSPLFPVSVGPTPEAVVRMLREPFGNTSAGVVEVPGDVGLWAFRARDFGVAVPPLDDYSLLVDLKRLEGGTGRLVLLRTDASDLDTAEWFLREDGAMGMGGVFGGSVPVGSWVRLGLVADSRSGTVTGFVDGEPVLQLAGVAGSGRWRLPDLFLLLGNPGVGKGGVRLNSVQLRNWAMTAAELRGLGGASAGGIPRPEPPSLEVSLPRPGAVVEAGQRLRIEWVSRSPEGLVRAESRASDGQVFVLGEAPMQLGAMDAWVPRWHPDGEAVVTVRSAEAGGPQDVVDGTVVVQGSRPLNPRFGQTLEFNGGFEDNLDHWNIVMGSPAVLSSGSPKGRAHGGSRFWHGGLNRPGDGIVRQEIDLGAAGFSGEDLGGAVVWGEAWLRSLQDSGVFDDQVFARITFLDAVGQELGAVRCLLAGSKAWQYRAMQSLLPPGTRRLGLEVIGRHRRDADNDSMVDDFSVRLRPLWPPVAAEPVITKLPMLQDVRQDAMRLLWETDSNLAVHAVEWGIGDPSQHTVGRVETVQVDDTHYVHRAEIRGLTAETEYRYRVRSGTTVSPTFTFRTAPRRNSPFVVAWWGDNHQGTDVLRTHVEHLMQHGPDLICVAGDMVNSGNSLEEWHEYWFKPLEHRNAAQTVPVIFARGNHDAEHALAYAYSTLPGNESWFAFDYGNTRMIFLDSEASGSVSPEQREWLRQELLRPETQQAAFRVVCFHKPPWSQFWNGGGHTQEEFVIREWTPLFRLNGVDLVISGHEHAYHRGARDGVTYVVSGGGGGFIDTERVANWRHVQVEYTRYHFDVMTVNGPRLTWEMYGTDHDLLDEFTLVSRIPTVGISTVPGGTVLKIEGRPGMRYQVEGTTDLQRWTREGEISIPVAGGTVEWPVGTGDASRFLRLVAMP